MDDQVKHQEDEYSFPYHHVVRRTNNRFSQCFNDEWGINYLATVEHLLDVISNEEFSSAIDVGCGDGRFSMELAKQFPSRRIVGVDISKRAISLAQAMFSYGEFRCVDIVSENLGDSFDLAVLMEVYEHIRPSDASEFCKALADLLTPGGILYVTVPHENKPVEAKHYRHFTSKSLQEELARDFDILSMTFFEKIDFRKKLIDILLTNDMFVLNNGTISNMLYGYYCKKLFLTNNEDVCQRILVRAQKKAAR